MVMKKILISFIILFLFSFPSLSSAKFISITTTIQAEMMSKNYTTVFLKLTNFGDEAAYNTRAVFLDQAYFQAEPIYVGQLNANESFERNATITLKDSKISPGKYTVPMMTEYSDANGYPFSSVSFVFVTYNRTSDSNVIGSLEELVVPLKGEKTLNLDIKNMDDTEHQLKISLYLPKELKAEMKNMTIPIEGKGEKTVKFIVENLAGLKESNYYILADLEYEEGGIHYSFPANGLIRISAEANPTAEITTSFWLIIGSVVLILVYAYFRLRK